MNQSLKEALDKKCKLIAAKHGTSEVFVNICIQVALINTKLGVIGTFAQSKHINVQESVNVLAGDTGNIVLVAAALAGIPEDKGEMIMKLYQEVAQEVTQLSTMMYTQAANEGKEKAS